LNEWDNAKKEQIRAAFILLPFPRLAVGEVATPETTIHDPINLSLLKSTEHKDT
jgi:hypothetical protein